METADQPSPLIASQLGEDPEDQGLRILARILARRLAKSRRDKNAIPYEQSEDDSPTVSGGRVADAVPQKGSISPSSVFEVKQSD